MAKKPMAKTKAKAKTNTKMKAKAQSKTTAKSAPKAPAKVVMISTVVKDPMTKSEMLKTLSESTGLVKKDVVSVLDGLNTLIERHIKKRGPGVFTLPGLIKIHLVRKPATKERKGVNPFTGEEIMIKAKPARSVVRVKALKKLKAMAE